MIARSVFHLSGCIHYTALVAVESTRRFRTSSPGSAHGASSRREVDPLEPPGVDRDDDRRRRREHRADCRRQQVSIGARTPAPEGFAVEENGDREERGDDAVDGTSARGRHGSRRDHRGHRRAIRAPRSDRGPSVPPRDHGAIRLRLRAAAALSASPHAARFGTEGPPHRGERVRWTGSNHVPGRLSLLSLFTLHVLQLEHCVRSALLRSLSSVSLLTEVTSRLLLSVSRGMNAPVGAKR